MPAKPSKVLRVWEDGLVHIKALTVFYLYHSQVPSWAEIFPWAWERRAAREALCFTSFMLWSVPCLTPQFGMPFYISTLIFKAPFFCSPPLFILSVLIPLYWGRGSRSNNSSHWFPKESLYSHFLSIRPLLKVRTLHSNSWVWIRLWDVGT